MRGDVWENQKGGIGGLMIEFIQSIVLAASVFVLVYLFVAQPNEVRGSSMYPSFEDGEYLLTDKLSYQFGQPQRGDVVVFKAPPTELCAEEECEYIKRIVALPGDRVMIRANSVYINGELLEEPYLGEEVVTLAGNFLMEGVEREVPLNAYLCLGDNREHSRDGREFGFIKKDLIVGKAFFVYWPPKAIGLVRVSD